MTETVYPRIGEKVLRETLPSGLQVLLIPKPGFARKYAAFTTHYGGMDMCFEQDGQWLKTPAGIAHYLEHKMFDTEQGNALQELAKNGAEPNAFTSNDITTYYFDSTEHFAENLRILLSFVSIPYFTEESVAKEQGIIGQEIGMIEDNPEWVVYKHLMECLYENSPARVSVAGSVESISHITAQTLYDCHKAFYTPSNMCLCVVGDIEMDEVLAIVREILPQEGGEVIKRYYGADEAPTPFQKESRCTMEVAMTTFLAGFKCQPVNGGMERIRLNFIGDLACDVLMGESSPLYAKLYADGAINGTFGSSFDMLPGVCYVYAGGDAADPNAVAAAILAEAKRLCTEGIDEEYYQRIRRANFGSTLKSLNSFESIAISHTQGCFDGYDPYRFPELFDTITKEDIIAFLRENIVESRMALSVIDPKEDTACI
jgi:predicted Zn-dependent peptidase